MAVLEAGTETELLRYEVRTVRQKSKRKGVSEEARSG